MKLNEVEVGSTVTVKKIEGDGAYKRRIMDMGITKGVELYIRKVAPLGDPVEEVMNYQLEKTMHNVLRLNNGGES